VSRVAGLLLAAGEGRRMGAPKQLLRLGRTSLVRRATQALLASGCDAVFAVLGAHADLVAPELADLPVSVVENPRWRDGLAGSIRRGVEAALAAGRFDAVLLALADQPGVTSALLARLIGEFEGAGRSLAACSYAGTLGAPALFSRRHFAALCALRGDRGAKELLRRHESEVARVPFEDAAIDVDTRQGYARAVALARGGPDARGER
jgi:molybdenum cofactor cytidylyltransferase